MTRRPQLLSPDQIYKFEGTLFDVACAAYALFAAPWIIATHRSVLDGTPVIWFGVLFALISVLETYALPKKMRIIHAAVDAHQDKDVLGSGTALLWMLHSVVSLILTMSVVQAAGIPITAEQDPPAWVSILIVFVILKEVALLGVFIFDDGGVDASYQRPYPGEWGLDLILISYACLAMSATWGMMSGPVFVDNTGESVANVFAASLLFLMFYLPTRVPYVVEELAQVETPADHRRFVLSLLLVTISALTAV